MNASTARKEEPLFEEGKGTFGPGRAGYPGEAFKESLFDIDNQPVKAHPGAVFEVIQGGLSEKRDPSDEDLLNAGYEQEVLKLTSAQRDRLGVVFPENNKRPIEQIIGQLIDEELKRPLLQPVRPTNSRRHAKVRSRTTIAELDEPFSEEAVNAA